ncbi:MAG: hypothetical protein PHS37_03645 [Candidatus Omnitrophica bacterium]|nr:hypothetical protein [Candidatus Omnitrophota bacterium]
MRVRLFEKIHTAVPYAAIYARLGYRKGLTRLTAEQKKQTDYLINCALQHLDVRGIARIMPLREIAKDRVVFCDDVAFNSVSLARLLARSSEALFMAATGGKEVAEEIRKSVRAKKIAKAIVFDAVASEMVDDGLGWIMSYYNTEFRRQNKVLTGRRFSAGYGDFLLDNQKIICNTLEVKRIGVRLTSSCMLVPEKSVTAIAGIRNI